ncbi:MAG: hypothetical protein J6J23_07215, partial [Clostridia bacterium]|nr:hypothetical protein [Clostridia bacterium]
SQETHGDKYDYSKVVYKNINTKVTIICPIHGEFEQIGMNHILGQGCPKCAGKGLNQDEIIEKFRGVHGDKYDYSKVEYTDMHNKVCIICPKHGEFYQTPSKHLIGQGCRKCGYNENGINNRMTQEEFITRANEVHKNKYDYSKVEYKTSHDKIIIICPKHGEFEQLPYDHLHGHGCPSCSNTFSIGEMEIYQYLCSKLGEENIVLHDRNILNGKELDIYIPSKKIGIEYNGLYWHSEINGKDKWYHINKLNECNEKGIKLIQIFEDEYLLNKELVLRKIEHILNIDRLCPKIMARKCNIRVICNEDAKSFLSKNHIQGYSNTTISYGAFYQGTLIGVMCFSKTGKSGEWILNRFATDNKYICQGVGGRMFSHFVKEYNPNSVKSFADRRWTVTSEKNLYTLIGFSLTGILQPEYRYINSINPKERIHKFNLRKKSLHRKYDLSMDMTEREMTEKLGYAKIWDYGLYKYEWKKQPE